MRALFVDILINADVQDPLQLWEAHKLHMVDDFLHDAQQVTAHLAFIETCIANKSESLLGVVHSPFFFFFFLFASHFSEAWLQVVVDKAVL